MDVIAVKYRTLILEALLLHFDGISTVNCKRKP